MVGYFSLYSSSQIVRQLGPGVLLVILSCYCAYAVYRHFGVPKSAGST